MSIYSYVFDNAFVNGDLFKQETEKLNTRACYRLRQQHFDTYKEIIKLYIKQLKKSYSLDSLEHLPKLPPFRTTCAGLQKEILKQKGKATIYAHRKRLMDTGIILDMYYDENQKYQYWQINPILLLKEGSEHVKSFVNELWKARNEAEKNRSKNEIIPIVSSVFEPLRARTLLQRTYTIDSEVQNVDNSSPNKKIRRASHRYIAKNTAKNTGKQGEFPAESQEQSIENSKKNVAAVAAKKNGQVAPRVDAPPNGGTRYGKTCPAQYGTAKRSNEKTQSREFPAFILNLVISFWTYAKQELYSERTYGLEREAQIKNTIYFNYFNINRYPRTEKQWLQEYECLMERVQVAKRYVERNYLNMPNPEDYFAAPTSDPNEFKFYRAQQIHGAQVYDRIRQELRRWQRGKGRHKDLSGTRLMQLHFQKITNTNDPQHIQLYKDKLIYAYTRKA